VGLSWQTAVDITCLHMQWTIENMWAFHIQPDGTPLSNSYQMEYCPVDYERPTYFQLSIAYVDINYCFANFKYVEGN
jgi:hypothetical protein